MSSQKIPSRDGERITVPTHIPTAPTVESQSRPFFESFDAADWARAFVEHVAANPAIPTDEACMLGWFANALMRGYDERERRDAPVIAELLAALRRMCGMYGAYSRRLAPLLAEDEGTVWTFERANELALEAIAKAEGR